MKLQLKKQFAGSKVIVTTKLGEISFDSNINNESEYEWYYNNGFAHLFEVSEIIESIETKQPKPKKYKGIKEDGKNK